jgi:hypothetical protein
MAMANLVATNRLWLRQRVRSIKDRIDQLREVLRLHTQEVEAAAEMVEEAEAATEAGVMPR